jgi:HAD superfamily hydrolase (TIGR01459 family)
VFELPGLIEVARPADADFLLNTGPDDLLGPADPALYDDVLNEALAAGLKMLCANPDLEVVRDGTRIICAGALAQVYAARGGTVIQRGKPDPAIYAPTLALLLLDAPRVLAIGDSLRTDIAGAKAAGVDSCWVLSGIHALDEVAAPAEAAQAGLSPVAILPGFRW